MKFFKSRLFRMLVSVISIILIVYLSRDIYSLWKRKDIISERRNALSELEKRNAELQRQLAQAQSSGFIERAAREKLGLIKEGEEIVLVPTGQSSGAGQSTNFQSSGNIPMWKQWWMLFF